MEEINVQNVNVETFNPFGATSEELIAIALDDSGLVVPTTMINGIEAKNFCKSYYEKRENYKSSTKIGNLLVKNYIITSEQLQQALEYQKKNPELRLGNILVELNFCDKEKLENCLSAQAQIRYDIKELDEFARKISVIKEKLMKYI